MIKTWFILCFLLLTLNARENPFFPAKGEKDIPYTSNQVKTLKPLKRSSITLPSSARTIKKVTIEYENLDASVAKKSIELDNSIDWHLPIFISQSISQNKKPPKKSIKKKNLKYKKIASVKYVTFFSSKKTLKIITKDKIIRNFFLATPARIVLDFKRDGRLKSYLKKNINNIFTKIRIGNHAGYYRAVIELDGQYKYKMQKIKNGYLIKLR